MFKKEREITTSHFYPLFHLFPCTCDEAAEIQLAVKKSFDENPWQLKSP